MKLSPYEAYEALKNTDDPLVEFSAPIDSFNPGKYVWGERGVRENTFKRNKFTIIGKDLVTYNDLVDFRYLCKFEFPVIVPDWLDIMFYNVQPRMEYVNGKDGFRYKMYTPSDPAGGPQ